MEITNNVSCPYYEKCYRKNPAHFKQFKHPHLEGILRQGRNKHNKQFIIPSKFSYDLVSVQLDILEGLLKQKSKLSHPEKTITMETDTCSGLANKIGTSQQNRRNGDIALPQGLNILEKLKMSFPYYMFLTSVADSPETFNDRLSITFKEIFDTCLGDIEASAQINFMVDINWLLKKYKSFGIDNTPLLILYGEKTSQMHDTWKNYSNVTAIKVHMPTPFSCPHAKIMLLCYRDGGLRIIISTANLYADDWYNRTQAVWISPKLNVLPEEDSTTNGESPTGFKHDFINFLKEYKVQQLQFFLSRIQKADFSEINVFFIGSAPGGFRPSTSRGYPFGHARLGDILKENVDDVDETVPIICQSSSIGSLGPNVQTWIEHDFLNSLRKNACAYLPRLPPFKLIYPTFGNVAQSYDGLIGGGCLPYGRNTHEKQLWLRSYLQQWKSDKRFRTRAVPHVKCYSRINIKENSVHWFLLTSANLSKAAWGSFNKAQNTQPCLRIANFEAGVLFIPKFVVGEKKFLLTSPGHGTPEFPIPYDVPLTPYGPDDKPFLIDCLT